MSSFEKIVRPFQNVGVTPPPRFIASGSSASAQIVVLQLGRKGSGKTFQGSTSYSQSFYMDTKEKEIAGINSAKLT